VTVLDEDGARAVEPGGAGQVRGWRDVARGVLAESKEDRITLLAAGVAFYGLLSLLPALLAVVSIYGLVADPDQVERQITSATRALPPDASHLLATQLHDLVATASTQGLGVRTALSIVLALWSASAGIKHLIDAVNVAYEEDESRSYVHVRAIALVLTVGAALFIVAAAALLAFLPALLSHVSLGSQARVLVSIIRFPLLAAAMMAGLSVVYRYGPDRTVRRSGWVSWGAGVAMVVWLVASAGLALYASQAGHINRIYGSLGAVIVLMLWLLLTALAVILGAEVNAELEGSGSRKSAPAGAAPG
jgi:membrane protein